MTSGQKAPPFSYRFQFSTCTQSGRVGPTQYQCDRAYQFMDINVTVLMDPPYAGVQVWTVPKTALYSITALGASGGNGADIAEISKGGYVSGKYNLSEGEQIYMLIGQRGQSVCDQIDPETRQPVPLVIAGGGGGHGLTKATNPINSDGGLVIGGDGRGAYTANNGAGGGGGWYGKADQPQAGTSLLCGGAGGSACRLKAQQIGWQMDDPDYQLDHLHNVLMPRNMEYNPNYDFGGAKCSLKDLRQIPRQHLLLIR
ncbi:hypothetical protein LSH36_869g00010 [Paralvinella palmiformis]|uniref:receptor protein-tyrosine kinase n=1 Tax=Paralvinella palmiformis TaxID=53620 RepID=A0AAD9J030_9ANNE|nr:hypothetical protein LSH36_869g00010 [Paralvinella palmiformis]